MKDPRIYITHALECIVRIQEYTSGGQDEFMASEMIQDAVIRNLQVLCESLSRVPDELQMKYPEIEWRGISGLRNILVHDYFGIDLSLVWQVVCVRLPALKASLERILTSL